MWSLSPPSPPGFFPQKGPPPPLLALLGVVSALTLGPAPAMARTRSRDVPLRAVKHGLFRIGEDRTEPVTRNELLSLQRRLGAEIVVGSRIRRTDGETRQVYGLFTSGERHACETPPDYGVGFVHTHPQLAAPSFEDLGSVGFARSLARDARAATDGAIPLTTAAQAIVHPRGVTLYTTASRLVAAHRNRRGKLVEGALDAFHLEPRNYRFAFDAVTGTVVVHPPADGPQLIRYRRGPVLSRRKLPARRTTPK